MSSSGIITIGFYVELLRKASDTHPPTSPWLNRRFARVARCAGVEQGTVTLVLVDDARMRDLHRRYKAQDTTTDVLTFDLRDDPGDVLEADLVLCVDEAVRQARRRGHTPREELLLYATHGLLHLLGYDDHDPGDARRMHRREDELLTAVGVGPRFRPAKDKPTS